MLKRSHVIISIFVLIAVTLACATPSGTPNQPENLETIVAATFAALTAPAPQNPTGDLLPHTLHFLNADSAGHAQIFRVEKDGTTITQLTFEPANVDFYDVSKIDGSIAYVSNNQIFTINVDGGNRAMIVDGGIKDEINPFVNVVTNPVWSPDGLKIAFGQKGLNFYSIIDGQSVNVLADQVDTSNSFPFPKELYRPEQYSFDGSKLLITLGYYEGASAAIYNPATNNLTRLTGGERAIICCNEMQWNQDGTSFYSASPSFGMFDAGLWRVDANTGVVSTLLLGTFDVQPVEVADEPYAGLDGQLYYFYGTAANPDEFGGRIPMQLVRAGLDGVTGRVVIRPETFMYLNDALWAEDASFVVIVNGAQDIYQGGRIELYYTDGQKNMIPLAPFGYNLKWGL